MIDVLLNKDLPQPDLSVERRPKGYIPPDPLDDPLYVVTTIYNPLRWKARWKHYERFAQHVIDSGGVLYTHEIAFGERHAATDYAGAHGSRAFCDFKEKMLQANRWWCTRTDEELWMKECGINRMVSRLPDTWRKVAWIDADVHFFRPNWVGETSHQLEHYKFVQMFGLAHDLNPKYEVMSTKPSFMKAYMDGTLEGLRKEGYYYPSKPGLGAWSGLAWACTREAWDSVGGLLDCCITGAADYYMSWALVSEKPGDVLQVIPKGSHPNFIQKILDWEMLCIRHIRRKVGFVSGSIGHHFHGKKSDRRYIHRSNLLAKHQFDPIKDLRYDWQGLIRLNDDGSERFIKIRDGIREWARLRNEDSNEE